MQIARHDVSQVRELADHLILPLQTRLEPDARTTTVRLAAVTVAASAAQKLEKDYDRDVKDQLEHVRKAQREVETWVKKARKLADGGQVSGSLNAARGRHECIIADAAQAQQSLQERLADVQAVRDAAMGAVRGCCGGAA